MSDSLNEGIRLYNSKRYELALEEFFSHTENPEDNPTMCYYVGLCYSKMERYEEALLYLEQVVTMHSNLLLIYQCRLILGYIYSVTKRYKLAEFELRQLIDSGFESPQVYSMFGYSSYCMARTEDSLSYLQKALTMDPDNANALNSIGYIMAEKDIDIPTALSYCKTALKKDPDNAAYLDSLGWAYFKAGKLEESREYLRRAMTQSGGHKTIAVHMREVLQGLGEA